MIQRRCGGVGSKKDVTSTWTDCKLVSREYSGRQRGVSCPRFLWVATDGIYASRRKMLQTWRNWNNWCRDVRVLLEKLTTLHICLDAGFDFFCACSTQWSAWVSSSMFRKTPQHYKAAQQEPEIRACITICMTLSWYLRCLRNHYLAVGT